MERVAGLKPMHELELEQHELKARARELLSEAIRDLRNAQGRINNELTWCNDDDERKPLFALRHEMEQETRKLEELYQAPPAPAEALQLRENAAQRRVQVEGWREYQDAAKAAAEDQRLRERQQRAADDPAPRPRGPGSRMG
jgi:hypothetical protein